MKFLRNLLDKYDPLFHKGGKLEKLYPLWEAQDTFLYTPSTTTSRGPHVRDGLDSKRLMILVVIALVPCILFGAYNAGLQAALAKGEPTSDMFGLFLSGMITILPIILCSYVVGGIWEVVFAVVRKHEINEGFLVTGILFPLVLPPTIPLWQVAVGVSFGVVIGKEVFGGTGMNILNPALTARAFLYFSFPAQISGDKVWVAADGFSGATALANAAATPNGTSAVDHLLHSTQTLAFPSDFMNMFYGFMPGSIGETSALACLIGAFILIITGVGSWRVMVAVLAGAWLTAFGLNQFHGPNVPGFFSLPAHYHLVMGGLMFGAVFMATDPVSAARTNTGKWIYGFLIGVLTILIRLVNPAYPEGVMLAILFMNVFAPLIDHYVVQANVRRRMRRVQA
ncbi:MAG: NADH:ubiquinone reductase (Na(+)-transporting) subunit B [Acidobacteria bacterium]|nr:NADH:ubiquinone reductase (Na(+)-transporting) subunit B [Acidobacteriota bacterium]MCB9399250.1 NADH:ubiquinone reductase (Na(+)-transporting) subunit B [Acidobacteriota bacterium]